jgi:hypothetical protein
MNASLENWLDQATCGLAPESVAKVRAEIREHCGAAVASGISEEEAIAALGDAWEANRSYRTVLLTTADAKWLENVRRRGNLPLFGSYVLATAGLVAGAAKLLQGGIFGALPALSMMVIGTVFLIPRWVRIDTRVRNRLYRALQWAVIISVPVALSAGGRLHSVFFVYLMFVCVAYKDYMLRRKLPVEEWPKDLYV